MIPSTDPRFGIRWTVSRKKDVVMAVRRGQFTEDEALRHFAISAEELASWQRLLMQWGDRGLSATRIQAYRGDLPDRIGEPKKRKRRQ